jgi:hypothetical protein
MPLSSTMKSPSDTPAIVTLSGSSWNISTFPMSCSSHAPSRFRCESLCARARRCRVREDE